MPPKKKINESEKIRTDETYKELMKEWIDICDHLEENTKCIKPIKDRKQVLETLLQEYMTENEIGSCQQSNNLFVKIDLKNGTPTINKSIIEKNAKLFFDNLLLNNSKTSEEIANEFISFIYANLEPIEKRTLKRIKL
jgi:hypothetical protein